MSRVFFWLMLCFVLAASSSAIPAQLSPSVAQAQSTDPVRIRQDLLPNMNDTKYPSVLGLGGKAYYAVTPSPDKTSSKRTVQLFTLNAPLDTTAYSGPEQLGTAIGKGDFSTAVITAGSDGAIYVAYMQSDSKTLRLRRRGPGDTSFGPERTVVSGGAFRVRPAIAVTTDNKIMVLWDEDSRYRYRVSTNEGVSWTETELLNNTYDAAGRAYIAADRSGGIWAAFATSGNSAGRIRVSRWNGTIGSNFSSSEDLTFDKSGNDYFADPSITVGANDIPYVAWRNVVGGIWFAERNPSTGNWNRSRLVGGSATSYGTVAISADSSNNLHLAWAGDTSGSFEVWYMFKPFNQAWKGPLRGSTDSDLDANFNVSSTLSDASYGLIVGERFTSGGTKSRSTIYRAGSAQCAGTLTLQGNAESGAATNALPVPYTITPNSGCTATPIEMQLSINAAPTSKDSPARVAYSASGTVINLGQQSSSCTQAVYAHLYQASNSQFAQSAIFSDTIKVDIDDVDASAAAWNLNAGITSTYSPFDLGTDPGASKGDPRWTRSEQFLLQIRDTGDCTGLLSYKVTADGSSTGIFNNTVDSPAVIPQSQLNTVGLKSFDIIVADKVANTREISTSIYYDPPNGPLNNLCGSPGCGLPVINAGTMSTDNASAEARKSILRTVTLTGLNISDNLYRSGNSGTQYWGVWVAVGTRNVTTNESLSSLTWIPIEVKSPSTSISVPVNLLGGRGALLNLDGTYRVYVRFLDGAGNPSATALAENFTLDPGYSLPSRALPLIRK